MKGLERLTFSHFIEDLIFRGKKVISTKKYNQHAHYWEKPCEEYVKFM